MTRLVLALLLLSVASPACACVAKTTERQRHADFRRLDANKDGYVSLAEFYAPNPLAFDIPADKKRRDFAAKDKNRDGRLSFREYDAWRRSLKCG